jgi:glycosyltransferase involved in cell wall biosynthesis
VADFAIAGQDPGFAGGVGTMMEELWQAVEALGRTPELHYLRYRQLDGTRTGSALIGRSVRPLLPGVDAVNVLAASARMAGGIRRARTRFVCAAVASHGFGAALAARPYGCWVATSLSAEWASHADARDPSHRVANATSAPLLRRLERTTVRRAAVRWTISPASRQAVAEAAGLPEAAIRVVPIPIDATRFVPLPDDEWEAGLAAPQLMFVGRAGDPRKNVGLLLDAFARLRERLPAARLTLVGEPPSGALPAGVEATGTVPSIADLLPRASLLVLPSLQEGFGLAVAEALAAGVPVLVTPCGGPVELVRSSGGGEVLSGFDPDELAERALALLADASLLREMRRRGRAYVVREHDPARFREVLAETVQVLDDGH